MKIQFQSEQLTIFESALFRTTSTVYVSKDVIIIVDPNWLPNEVAEIRNYVDSKWVDQNIYLLLTHSDYDHIIGCEAFPDATVIASKSFQDNPSKSESIRLINEFDDQYYISRDYPIVYPEVHIDIEEEKYCYRVGNTALTFYQAKGHNSDGLFTIIEPEGIFIAGDYLSNIEFPYVYDNFDDYQKTLDKVEKILENHTINYMITGHGDYTTDIKEIKRRKKESQEYIEALKTSIIKDEPFDFNQLMEKYDYPIIMKKFHDSNIELLKKELSNS